MSEEQEVLTALPMALDARTRDEIDIAISTAKRWPRQLARFSDDVTSMATIDAETAAGCFYSLRRQGKTIQGPSVRLAEIAVSAWGNIRAGARILGETSDGKFVRAEGMCYDLEKNVMVAIEAQRRITNKNGRYSDDMIGVTSNAAAAIGFRNAVLKVIPRAMLKRAYEEAKKVATGNAKTLGEKREQVFERLRALNPTITDVKILGAIGRPSIQEVTLEDVTHLIGLGTAIKDGQQSIDEAFPEPPVPTSAADILGASEGRGERGAGGPERKRPKAAAKETAPGDPAEIAADLEAMAVAEGVSWDDVIQRLGPPDRWATRGIEPGDVRREITKLAKDLKATPR